MALCGRYRRPGAGESLASYELLVAKRGDESLFVVNRSAAPFPLARLSLGNDKGGVNGADWGIEMLDSGACVAIWKDDGDPKPPEGVACRETGQRLMRGKGSRFWRSAFNIFYGGNLIGICQKEQKQCFVSIPLE